MKAKHPGFKKAAQSIAKKQNLPIERANAILAAGARGAGKMAVKENPRLKRVRHPLAKKYDGIVH